MIYFMPMNRRQKRILTILGIVDLIVVVALGVTLGHDLWSPSPVRTDFLPAACPQGLLQALPPSLQPAVAWTPDRLDLMLNAHYAAPTPPAETPQLLWKALDSIAAMLRLGCSAPTQVTIRLTANGETVTQYHIVELEGAELAAWAAGTLSEAELATHATYRQLPSQVDGKP